MGAIQEELLIYNIVMTAPEITQMKNKINGSDSAAFFRH